MKGDGEDCVVRDFLSLGSTNMSGREKEGIGNNLGRQGDEHSLYWTMLASLSRNGLSMLAGGANGGFSLKPLVVGMPSLCNVAVEGASEGASVVSGGGFTGFTGFRARVPQTRSSLPPIGLRFGSEETKVKDEAGASSSHFGNSSIAGKMEQPVSADVHKLSTDECWKLILKLGTQWPAWNGATASQETQGLMKEDDATVEVADHGHHSDNEERVQGGKPATLQRGQDFLKLLATRALEALAQSPPDHHGKAAGGMLAPKQTTQEIKNPKAAEDAPETPTELTEPTSSLAKAPTSSREMLAPKTTLTRPRTAALTIFYDGVVNVCDNVPADKARLIMMFAEKAGIPLNAQSLLRSVRCVTPSLESSSQITPASVPNPPESGISQEDNQHSKPSSQVAMLAGISSVPSDLAPSANDVGGSTSDQKLVRSSNPAKTVIAEPSPMPRKITVTTEGNSRYQVIVKPLPNARKNSLARFLDSRKRSRGTASCSEGGPPKKPALGDGCSSDAEDVKGSGKSPMPLCSQSSFDSKEGICAMCTKAPDRAHQMLR